MDGETEGKSSHLKQYFHLEVSLSCHLGVIWLPCCPSSPSQTTAPVLHLNSAHYWIASLESLCCIRGHVAQPKRRSDRGKGAYETSNPCFLINAEISLFKSSDVLDGRVLTEKSKFKRGIGVWLVRKSQCFLQKLDTCRKKLPELKIDYSKSSDYKCWFKAFLSMRYKVFEDPEKRLLRWPHLMDNVKKLRAWFLFAPWILICSFIK